MSPTYTMAQAPGRLPVVGRAAAEDRAFDKGGRIFDTFRKTAGNGLLGCPARDHRGQRRLVQPAFHHLRMPVYWRPGQLLRGGSRADVAQ